MQKLELPMKVGFKVYGLWAFEASNVLQGLREVCVVLLEVQLSLSPKP